MSLRDDSDPSSELFFTRVHLHGCRFGFDPKTISKDFYELLGNRVTQVCMLQAKKGKKGQGAANEEQIDTEHHG